MQAIKILLKSVKIENFTGYLNDQRFQSVDLYQEGIEGILYNDGNTILYFRPNGNGEFAKANLLERFPLFLRKPSYSLLSLEGNGELQLYVNENGFQGYHDFDGKSKWSEFKPLESQVINLSSEFQEMIDVTGDGRTDIVVFEGESVRVYPSQGKKGYKKAIYSKAPKDLPNKRANSESTLIRFADMFGDGKSHLVKIEDGKIECWPNLGYGKFGEKVTFKNAPYFRNGFNAKRLYFADIDGSGTTDLVYANHNSLDIYYNNSGNSFSKPVTLKLPVDYNHISRIEFADILGNGTSCLLISYLNQNLKLQHLYYDFYNGVKPHLLKQIDNNMGNITRLHYAASTKFYLQDRKENRPWVTSLPFPVQVIEKIETIDNIVGSKLINKYRYHHGFYDYIEKEFRGFGFVETWDTEDFENVDEKEHYVAPIYTKTWYHTGAYKKAVDLVESYRKEFYQEDKKALKVVPNVLDENITTIEDKRQAYRAIQGQMLRQEVYGLDKNENPNLYEHPYSVTESSAAVKLLRSSSSNNHKEFKYGIFFVNVQETINYHYERHCCDPRIQHDVVLEVDEYGNVIKSASITYPRRNQVNNYFEQQKLHITLENNFYINNTQEFYLLGTLYKSQAFEIGGLKIENDEYTNVGDLRAHVAKSLTNTIKFEESLRDTIPQARLLSENHNYYWNKEQNAILALGSVTQQALLHHTEAMAFSDSQIKEVFAGKITSDQMLEDLGYKKSTFSWWVASPTQYYYGANKYYLPKKVIDVFGSETAVVYDQYALLPIKTIVKATAKSNYETRAEYDYQRLTPVKLIDNNDNVSEVILNPLGVVIATSMYGSEKGETKGDKPLSEYKIRKSPSFEDILGITNQANSPEYYLQNATSFFYYDLEAWRNNGQPVHIINLQRETYVSNDIPTRIRRVVTHIDGFGRNLETKMLSNAETEEWLTSGRVVYNNKGKEVKKYEPFYGNKPYYDFEEAVRNQGVSETLYYDPLLRNIRIDTAKGFFSKIEFDSWSTKNFDLNDRVKDSKYYEEFSMKWSKANEQEKIALKNEKDALDKAVKHYNTPTIEHLDSLGRKFLQIEILSKDGQNNIELKSHVKLDIQGNERESVDSRFYEDNKSKRENERIKNFIHIYSMAGLLKSISIDAGDNWSLANVAGSAVYNWDSKGSCTHTEYDKLQRPIKVKVTYEKLSLNNNIVERFFYSENIADKASNRYGTLIAHYDQAGLTKVEENDFKGQTLKSSYYLRKNYKQEANWQNIESIVTAHSDLEREVFNSSIKYNALGEVTEKTDVQNNTHIPIYDIAGRVKEIKLKKQGEKIKTYVSDISYNSKGQRISISYGNGVITNYSYDSKTFRLTKLESTKGQKKLQSINYTYDPVGNITRMKDDSYQEIFPNSKSIDTTSNYHYDSLYRLIQATGKEHPALSGKRGVSDKDDYIIPIPHLNNQNAISNYTEYYDFDYGSNITKIRHVGENSSTKEFYISNKSNRSLAIVDNRPINESDIDKSYDERGNLLKLHSSKNLNWNYRDNTAYVNIITRPSGKNDSEYYVYDSGGQRIRKVTETYQNSESNYTRVEKIYFGDIEVTRTYQDNNLKKEKYSIHIADDKSKVALNKYWTKGTPDETRGDQDRYQLGNHLDSVALELNDKAEIITYEEYLPFGGTALIAGKTAREVSEKEYRYSGKERDDSTGLYYYGARYYAPWLARWINPDPAGTIDGLNLFQFVGGNPVNSVDVGGKARQMINDDVASTFQMRNNGIYTIGNIPGLNNLANLSQNEEDCVRNMQHHMISRFRDPFVALAIAQRNNVNVNFQHAGFQDHTSGLGNSMHAAHTVAGDANVLRNSDLARRLAHTQTIERIMNETRSGGFGYVVDVFYRSNEIFNQNIRNIDFSSEGYLNEHLTAARNIFTEYANLFTEAPQSIISDNMIRSIGGGVFDANNLNIMRTRVIDALSGGYAHYRCTGFFNEMSLDQQTEFINYRLDYQAQAILQLGQHDQRDVEQNLEMEQRINPQFNDAISSRGLSDRIAYFNQQNT
ncbi:toxin TcdB middle/N-terminal domain-containing protein [Wolbachia endosymbiont of Chironomus riparius]|uniref:toxin TcdB middle/N-terminal domain-containing protein n=1 Tax=Wolbachia endosymbiont of Chironomus riparius TaxID=2883238 RepID=UPI00209D0854|nr:toxin TcdB middle/N-terminal domain-containing protein [Wolbachia endosymbiont of Chironomus riparius]